MAVGPTCENCPFIDYDGNYGRSYDSGYDCNHSNLFRIVDDWEIDNSNNKSPKGWPLIPVKCPLPKVEVKEIV